MKRQQLISKGSLSRLFQEAAEAWRRQGYSESIALLERASRLDPGNPRIPLDLGRAYGLRYEYASAERCFEKAIRIAPRKVDALLAAGQRAQEFGSHELARRYFAQAAEQKSFPAEGLVRLAELCEREHRLEEAASLVDRALSSNPGHPSALLTQARLDRGAGRLDEAECRLRSIVARGDVDSWIRVRTWYELGGILDRQSRYDHAMEAFLEAKAILRPAAGPSTNALRMVHERVREMEATITPEVLKVWVDQGAELQPAYRIALLCGHPRSGTTLLEQVLDSHPAIVSAEETHVFHDEAYLPLTRDQAPETSLLSLLGSTPKSLLQESRKNYFNYTELFLGSAIGNRLLLDKNPSLSVMAPVVARIFPEIKFVAALRDPRDVCLSCFMQPLPLSPVSSAYLSLEGTVAEYASVMGLWRTMAQRMPNPSIEVRYEELVGDLETVSSRVLAFLGISWDERVLRFNEHARGKLVRSPTYAEVAKPVFKSAIGRWRNYQKYIEPWVEKLKPFIKAWGYE